MSPLDVAEPVTEIQRYEALDSSIHDESFVTQRTKVPARLLKTIPHPVATAFSKCLPHGINWANFVWMAIINTGAVAAFWHFSWPGLATAVFLHWVTACLGVTLGYHRLLTHGSFTAPKWFEYFCSLCAMIAAEGSPAFWVATHRKHHVLSDQPGDPHSPNDGFWWSHMLWFKPKVLRADEDAMIARWAPDMWKDPVQRVFHRIFPLFPILLGAGLFLLGEWMLLRGWATTGWSMLLWGMCVRMIACYHSTWLINSASHIWGYRTYETNDRSRNLWWAALLSYGEGWHNNHHAHQKLAIYAHRWWELDITYMVIWVLKKVGIAKNVCDQLPARPH